MSYWNAYKSRIHNICTEDSVDDTGIVYWQNNFFAGIITYILPFCLIALVPGIYVSIITGKYVLAGVDALTVTGLIFVAFIHGLSVKQRKIIFILCLYLLTCVMLLYLGLFGPGLVYLLANSIFSILIFSTTSKLWTAWLNTGICLMFATSIVLLHTPWIEERPHALVEWITVSSNLIFLSFLFAILMARLLKGLQETIDRERQLRAGLNAQKYVLQQTLLMLQRKNEDLEQFTYVASHDMNEPLRMITSFMGLLQKKYGDQLDEKANVYIDFAIDGGKRLQHMISALLELSRTGRHDSGKEVLSLHLMLQEAMHNISKLIDESEAEITASTESAEILGFKSDIVRLFQNLLSNAIKFKHSEVKPQIVMNVSTRENQWLVSIQDNGIGIDNSDKEKIFEIFNRVHGHKYEGSGIGLAVCKKIVEQHGGTIWVDSEQGAGSVFYFTLEKVSSTRA